MQEATNNIVKHSGARQARVRLHRDDGWLRVHIDDDGRGFRAEPNDSMARAAQSGFGLPGMAERVKIPTIRVKSAPGQGTRLDLTLPIPTHGEKHPDTAGG